MRDETGGKNQSQLGKITPEGLAADKQLSASERDGSDRVNSVAKPFGLKENASHDTS